VAFKRAVLMIMGLTTAAAIVIAVMIFPSKQSTEEIIAVNTAHDDIAIVTISDNKTYALSDDMIMSFNGVHGNIGNQILESHPYQSAFPLGKDSNRLPYLNITSDSYLELRNITKLVLLPPISDSKLVAVTNSTIVEIINRGCNATEKSQEDYVYRSVDYCTFEIMKEQIAVEDIPKFNAMTNYTIRLDFSTRDPDLIKIYESAENNSDTNKFMAIRFLGLTIGNDFSTGFDVITNYGVKNIDLKSAPLGHEERIILGPEEINIKILDAAIRRCDDACRNIFDVSITVNTIDDPSKYPVKILSYN
jgi:hypothetical protein